MKINKNFKLSQSNLPFIWLMGFMLLIGYACADLPTQEGIEDEISDAFFAVPLLNDTLTIPDFFSENGDSNASYSVDELGRVTITYKGEVLREGADIVFPPVYSFGAIQLLDTVFVIDFGMGSSNEIDSAVFKGDKLWFSYESTLDEPVFVTASIQEIKKDGKPLTEIIEIPAGNNEKQIIKGMEFSLKGLDLIGNENKLTLRYDARTSSGERVILDKVTVEYTILRFDYLQGYFPKTVRPVEGSFIPVGLYGSWISGSMDFVDPKISIQVENAFGFPVGSKFNSMSLTTIDGEIFELESEILEQGIVFNYPSLQEIGEIKHTDFYFDSSNSNLQLIFENKVKQVNYDIDALANPNDIPDFIGFMTSSSYYSVLLQVEVPLHLTIDNLVVENTADFSFEQENDAIDTLELKLILENTYPVDLYAQGYLLDEQDNVIDSLFSDGLISLQGAETDGAGTILNSEKNVFYFNWGVEDIDRILKTKKLKMRARLHTLDDYAEPIWIYDSYGLQVKAGAKFSLL